MDLEVEECLIKSFKDLFEIKWYLRWGLYVFESIVII